MHKKLQILRASPNYEELIVLYGKKKYPKLKEHFHALVLMYELKNCSKVVQLVKKMRKTIPLWINAFNEGRIDAIVPDSPP